LIKKRGEKKKADPWEKKKHLKGWGSLKKVHFGKKKGTKKIETKKPRRREKKGIFVSRGGLESGWGTSVLWALGTPFPGEFGEGDGQRGGGGGSKRGKNP